MRARERERERKLLNDALKSTMIHTLLHAFKAIIISTTTMKVECTTSV